MRSTLTALLALGLLFCGMPAAAVPTSPTTSLSTPWSVGPKQDRYEAWPDAVTADNGWVVLAHASTDSHGFPTRRKTVIRVSKDRGRTFTVAKTITSENMSGLEGIIRLPSGRLLLLLSDLDDHDHFNYVRSWKSDDDGLTWAPLSARIPWTDPWSFGNLVRLTCDGGKIITAWNNGTRWGIATTLDEGRTWTRTYKSAQHHLYEGRITQVSGDKLIMLGRTDDGLLLFRSPDCGRTWTSAPTGIPGRLSEGAVRHGDLWRVVTINRENFRMEVRDASVSELYSNPRAWSPPKLLRTLRATTSPVDLGYPTVLNVSRSYDALFWYGATDKLREPMIYGAHLPWTG